MWNKFVDPAAPYNIEIPKIKITDEVAPKTKNLIPASTPWPEPLFNDTNAYKHILWISNAKNIVNKSTDEIKNSIPKTTKRYKMKYSKQADRLRFKEFFDIIKQNIEMIKQNNLTNEEPKSKTSKFSYNKRPERPKLTQTKNEVITKIKIDKKVNSETNA